MAYEDAILSDTTDYIKKLKKELGFYSTRISSKQFLSHFCQYECESPPVQDTNHTEAGDAVLSTTRVHVAGLLARWPHQTLRDAERLVHHLRGHRVLNNTLHSAILHASVTGGRALAVDTSSVSVCAHLPWVLTSGHRSGGVDRVNVFIQAWKISSCEQLERNKEKKNYGGKCTNVQFQC